MNTYNKLTEWLLDEWQAKRKCGLYHKTQVQLAYNSNRIESSKLTEEIIKKFHRILKTGSADSHKSHFNTGDYKQLANEVGGRKICKPAVVIKDINAMHEWNGADRYEIEAICTAIGWNCDRMMTL